MNRKCKVCNQEKELTEEFFPISGKKNNTTYFRHACKPCHYSQYHSWANDNKDLIAKYNKEYKKNNPDYGHKLHQANKRIRKDKVNQRKKNDPLYALQWRVRTLIYVQVVRDGKYSKKTGTFQMVGCSIEELFNHLGIKTKEDLKNKHIDHICPISQAQNEEELIKLQHYTNLRIIPSKDNLIKNNLKTLEGEVLCRSLLGREWMYKINYLGYV
jgi:hypothetical protein